MNTLFAFLYPLSLLLIVGFSVLISLNSFSNKPILYRTGLAYGIGVGCITVQMMIYSFLNIGWTIISLGFPWTAIFVYLILAKRIEIPKFQLKNNLDKTELLIFIAIASTILFVIFEASIRPLTAYDALVNWFLRGKAYYISGSLDPSFIIYSINSTPPLLSLLVTFVYLSIGQISEQIAIYFFTFFYVALLIVFYFSSRDFMSRKYALLFTFLLATLGDLIRHAGRYDVGHADLPLGFFIFCASVFILKLLKDKSFKNLILFNLFIIPCSLMKNEGVPIFIVLQFIVFIIFLSQKKNFAKYFFQLLIGTFVILIWYTFKHLNNLPENPVVRSEIELIRTPNILKEMLKELIYVTRWNFLWITFIISLAFFKKNKYSLILGAICLSLISVYFVVFLVTPFDPIMQVRGSFDRLLLHIAPVAMLMIGIIVTNLNPPVFKKKGIS